MNFQAIAGARARLAPRSPWQAADLGTRMYRHWAGPTTRVWLAFTALPFVLVLLSGYLTQSVWPLVLFWWLKPLWERPLLAFYSHALFGETLGLAALFRRCRQYALPGLAAQLTWRRLSPARSVNACVWQLEGARGDQLGRRLQVLNTIPSNRAGVLTLVMLHLEQFMVLGLLALLFMLMPWQFNLEWSDWFVDQNRLHTLIISLCYYAVLVVTEPLYVACGFALYLNKRTWLEGWDLQLGFSRIARHRGAMSALLLALVLPLLLPTPSQAQPPLEEEKRQAIEILAGPDFMPLEERTRREWADQDGESWVNKLWRWLFDNLDRDNPEPIQLDWPATVLRALMWILFAALALWVIIKVVEQLGLGRGGGRRRHTLPTHVAGLDIRRQHLPENLDQAVEEALAGGDVRLALSLLLRSALAGLLPRYPVPLAAGSTEQHCLRLLKRAHGSPAPIRFLETLIQAWVATAWAHRPVSPERVSVLLREWHQLAPPTEVDHAPA